MRNSQLYELIDFHGVNYEKIPETLLPDLDCRTTKIDYTRLIDKNGNGVVITSGGTWLPKTDMFCSEGLSMKS